MHEGLGHSSMGLLYSWPDLAAERVEIGRLCRMLHIIYSVVCHGHEVPCVITYGDQARV